MSVRRARTILCTAAITTLAGVGSLVTGTAANATPPGSGVKGTIVWERTVGSTHYVLRKITIPAGQSTGWHFHDGMLYAKVRKGTLSHFDSNCRRDGFYHRGQRLIEPSGPNHVHIGRNLGHTDVQLEVLYVLPVGSPLSQDAPNPGCNFQ